MFEIWDFFYVSNNSAGNLKDSNLMQSDIFSFENVNQVKRRIWLFEIVTAKTKLSTICEKIYNRSALTNDNKPLYKEPQESPFVLDPSDCM